MLKGFLIRRRFVMPGNVIFDVMAKNIDQAFMGVRVFSAATRRPLVPARSKRFIQELNDAV